MIDGKRISKVYQDEGYLDLWFDDGAILKITGTFQVEVVIKDGSPADEELKRKAQLQREEGIRDWNAELLKGIWGHGGSVND